jgi:hypothetical protein
VVSGVVAVLRARTHTHTYTQEIAGLSSAYVDNQCTPNQFITVLYFLSFELMCAYIILNIGERACPQPCRLPACHPWSPTCAHMAPRSPPLAPSSAPATASPPAGTCPRLPSPPLLLAVVAIILEGMINDEADELLPVPRSAMTAFGEVRGGPVTQGPDVRCNTRRGPLP